MCLEKLERDAFSDTKFGCHAASSNVLLPENLVNLFRGKPEMRDGPRGRNCRIELMKEAPPFGNTPVGIFAAHGCGWFNQYEVVTIVAQERRIMWKRLRNVAEITIDGVPVGELRLSWSLQLLFIGTGDVIWNGKPFCSFALPFFGPSTPQVHDCTGTIKLTSSGASVHFIINPSKGGVRNGAGKCGVSLFNSAAQSLFSSISEEQRLLVLAISIWPWSLYKLGAGG